VIAGVLPAGEVDAVRQLQDGGRVVVMAGDGVNDAAIEVSDLTLLRGDLLAVRDAILLFRRTLATIKGNPF
jgi:P-type Cu+ transporter